MTKSFRTRLALTVSALAVLAAGAVVAAQAFAAGTTAAPAQTAGTTAATADGAAAVTMNDWTETGRRGSVIVP
jgi:hypothetical protein